MKMKDVHLMDVEELKKYIVENDILLPHIKAVVDTLDGDWCYVVTLFEIHVPAIRKVDSYPHDDEAINVTLKENMGIDLVHACKQTVGMKNRIDTLTTIPLLMTMNQMNLAQVEFRGGEPSGFHLAQTDEKSDNNGFNKLNSEDETEEKEKEYDEDGYMIMRVNDYVTSRVNEVPIVICSGLPVIRDSDIKVLEDEYGMTEIITVTPDAANLAHISAGALDIKMVQHKDHKKPELVYHKFGDTKQFALSKPYEDNTLTTSTISKCRLMFELPCMSKDAMVHEVATYLTAHKDKMSKIPRSKIDKIDYKDGYQGKKFMDYPLKTLEVMWEKVRAMASRYLNLLKDQDTGFSQLNAPLKWAPVISYLSTTGPYCKKGRDVVSNERYDRNFEAVLYGAGLGRMDALMRSYFSTFSTRDIAPFQATSKKLDEEEIKRLKIPKWDYGDITAYKRGDETFMISDVFMKSWRGTNGNALMSKFIAGLLRGEIVSGNDSRSFGDTDGLKLGAKMVLPHFASLDEFEGSYPFVLAITGRPTTSEVILIKDFTAAESNFPAHVRTLATLCEQFGDVSMSSRFLIITNRREFEHMIKFKLASQLSETFMHLDKLTTDWVSPFASARIRKWYLAGPQIPNLYRTMKINLGVGSNAWTFDTVMNSLLKIDLDGYSLGFEEQEEVKDVVVVDPKKKVKLKEPEPEGTVMVAKFNAKAPLW